MKALLHAALIGVLGGVFALLVLHQGTIFAMNWLGWIPTRPWNLAPVPPYGLPFLAMQAIWAGLWGAAFGLLLRFVGAPTLFVGAVLGVAAAVGMHFGLGQPIFRGTPGLAPLTAPAIGRGLLVAAAFGWGVAFIHHAFFRRG